MFSAFFAELKHPLINTRVQLEFSVAGAAPGSAYSPILRETTVGACTLAIASQTRLVVYKVELQAAEQVKFAHQLESGKKTNITFWDQKHYKSAVDTAFGTNEQSTIIVPSIRNPKRVWALHTSQANWASQTSTQPCTTSTVSRFERSNLEVNTKKMFPNDIDSEYEHFKLLQRETFSGEDSRNNGCLLTFNNWLEGVHRYYAYNISRSEHAIKDPAEPVQLRFTGTKRATDASEIHFIVEFEVSVAINMTSGEVTRIGA